MTLKTVSIAAVLLTFSVGAFAQTMNSQSATPGQQIQPAYNNYTDHDTAVKRTPDNQLQQAPKTNDSVTDQNKSN